jgi:Mg-chelatase subunit ChlD
MTDPGSRHIVLVIDRSGSMRPVAADTEGGVKTFIEEQRKVPGRTTVSLFQFDTEHDEVASFADVQGDLAWRLVPRGGTALLDAVGFAVTKTGERLAALDESARPGEVVVLIATDGEENSSKEYTLPQVKDMITRQQDDYGWKFVFIGANQDAFDAGGAMGVPAAATADYSTASTAGAFASAASMVARGASIGAYGFTPGERAAAVGADKPDDE